MTDYRALLAVFVACLLIVGLATVALHENHYKDRRWRVLDGRLSTLEQIILEDRRT